MSKRRKALGKVVGYSELPEDKYGLFRVLKIQSSGRNETVMVDFIMRELEAMGRTFFQDNAGNIFVPGVGDYGAMVVAHMDTVHSIVGNARDSLKLRHRNGFLDSPTGIGGDDKVGVWVALEALRKYPCVRGAFFSQEESGCIGSNFADMDVFQDMGVGWCIQADRRGKEDFVVSDWGGYRGEPNLCSWKFVGLVGGIALGKYNYELCWSGTSTDVYTLSERGIGVSCVNVSAGYYNEHTKGETVCIEDAYRCKRMVLEALGRYGTEYFENWRPVKTVHSFSGRGRYYDEEYDDKYGMYAVTSSRPKAATTITDVDVEEEDLRGRLADTKLSTVTKKLTGEDDWDESARKHEPFTLNGRYYTWNAERNAWDFKELEKESPQATAESTLSELESSLTPDQRDMLRRVDLGEDAE